MENYQERWKQLLSAKRFKINSGEEDSRNEFHKDYDRVIFCSAFRRLGKKTQVHPLANNDHIHTRLTHSLEVSSVGRSLGQKFGEFLHVRGDLPTGITTQDIAAIVQAACLAHDIGNPPFGHAGEYAVRHWFKENQAKIRWDDRHELNDLLFFEGNAQGFRVVTQIENRRFEGGLNLTYATLGTLVKYPWFASVKDIEKKQKFNFFKTEEKIARDIFAEIGLFDANKNKFERHPLSYLMEGADDICYKVLDIEDGLELGLLRYDEVKSLLVKLAGNEYDPDRIENEWSERRKIYYLRARAIKNLIKEVIGVCTKNYEKIMRSEFHGDLISKVGGDVEKGIKKAKKITQENIFLYKRKVHLELGAYETMSTILASLIEAVNEYKEEGKEVSFKSQLIKRLVGPSYFPEDKSYYENYMLIMDQVSGMTDDYATYIAGQLRGYVR